jgi:hypothetical protein
MSHATEEDSTMEPTDVIDVMDITDLTSKLDTVHLSGIVIRIYNHSKPLEDCTFKLQVSEDEPWSIVSKRIGGILGMSYHSFCIYLGREHRSDRYPPNAEFWKACRIGKPVLVRHYACKCIS